MNACECLQCFSFKWSYHLCRCIIPSICREFHNSWQHLPTYTETFTEIQCQSQNLAPYFETLTSFPFDFSVKIFTNQKVRLMVCPPSKANSPFYVHQILWTQNILKHIFGDYLSDFVESIRWSSSVLWWLIGQIKYVYGLVLGIFEYLSIVCVACNWQQQSPLICWKKFCSFVEE